MEAKWWFLGLGCVLLPDGRAATIDLFGDAQQVELAAPSTQRTAAPGVSLTDSLFDTRELEVQYGVQRLSVMGGSLSYQLFPEPEGFLGNDRGYPAVIYTSVSGVDLLADGATAFRLAIESYQTSPVTGGRTTLRLSLASGGNPQQFHIGELTFGIPGPLEIEIPFSFFDRIDLSSVDELILGSLRMWPEVSFEITSLATVPEASPQVLAGIGAVLLVLRRSRNGSCTKVSKSS